MLSGIDTNMTIDPLLTFVNTQMNDSGLPIRGELWFYTPDVVYKVRLYDSKYYVTRFSHKVIPCGDFPEVLPLLESGDIPGVLGILRQEPFFLTEAQVLAQWGPNYVPFPHVEPL